MTTSGGSPRKPAGSRDLFGTQPMAALFPGEQVRTSAMQPVFLIYLPQQTARQGELILAQNGNFNYPIYRQTLDLPASAGLLRIEIPTDLLPAWSPETSYDWQFSLISLFPGRGNPIAITEQIHRVEIAPDRQTQLSQLSPQERVPLYYTLDLPYDACIELDQLRRRPTVESWVQETWAAWMIGKGLQHFATVPPI